MEGAKGKQGKNKTAGTEGQGTQKARRGQCSAWAPKETVETKPIGMPDQGSAEPKGGRFL